MGMREALQTEAALAERGTGAARGDRRRLPAHELLARADRLMYDAKAQGNGHISPVRVRVVDGALEEIGADEHPE